MIAWAIAAGVPAAVVIAAGLAIRQLRRRRYGGAYGDDTVTLFCRHCHGEPLQDCTCRKDCGRPDCPWPMWNLLATDAEIMAMIAAIAQRGRDSSSG